LANAYEAGTGRPDPRTGEPWRKPAEPLRKLATGHAVLPDRCIAGAGAGEHSDAKQSDEMMFGTRLVIALRRFTWLSFISFSDWMKIPVGTIALSFAASDLACCYNNASWIAFDRVSAAVIS
jgi:hypothetical protein